MMNNTKNQSDTSNAPHDEQHKKARANSVCQGAGARNDMYKPYMSDAATHPMTNDEGF